MAIARGNTASGSGSGTSLSVTLDAGSGTDRFLVVEVRASGGTGNTTGVTYSGVSMTELGADQAAGGTNFSTTWWLAAPATGSNSVVITLGASSGISMVTANYTGVAQNAPEVSAQGSWTGGTSFSQSTTTLADNAWVILSGRDNYGTGTAGANTSSIVTQANGDLIYEYTSNPKTPAGSQTLNATFNSLVTFGWHQFSIAPVIATTDVKTRNTVAIANIQTVNTVS